MADAGSDAEGGAEYFLGEEWKPNRLVAPPPFDEGGGGVAEEEAVQFLTRYAN